MSTLLISTTVIPLIVGIAALTLLDHSLGNMSTDGFRRIFQNKEIRLIALFGAAYGANGGRTLPALVAMLIYNFLENDSEILNNYFGIDPFDFINDKTKVKNVKEVFESEISLIPVSERMEEAATDIVNNTFDKSDEL